MIQQIKCQDIILHIGEGIKINAKKETVDSQTKYTLEDGEELIINDGNTFIFLVPTSQDIDIEGKKKTEEELSKEEEERKKYILLEELEKDKRLKITKFNYNNLLENNNISFIEKIKNIFKKDKEKENNINDNISEEKKEENKNIKTENKESDE